MLRIMLVALLLTFSLHSVADESECSRLAAQTERPDDSYFPPLEAKVIGKGRLQFYTAPSKACPMNGIFVVNGDFLTLYKSLNGWANVMYIAKNGEDYMGWVLESRINKLGHYGQ